MTEVDAAFVFPEWVPPSVVIAAAAEADYEAFLAVQRANAAK